MDIKELNCSKALFNLSSIGDYIIAYGDGLYVFTKKGKLVFAKELLKNIYKVAALPNNRIIVDCSKTRSYVIISLTDGDELCHIKQPKMDYSSLKFTVSKDGKFVYDYYFLKLICHIIKINVDEMSFDTVMLQPGLRATMDMICDDNGTLCILQGHNEMIANDEISACGIRYEYFDPCMGCGNAYYWKAKWYYSYLNSKSLFFGTVDRIVTGDYYIYDIPEKSKLFILEESNAIKIKCPNLENGEPVIIDTDPFWCSVLNDRYVQFVCSESNIIVDKIHNRIVARYFSQATSGCVVGNEFWICSTEGILRKKFPFIESEALRTKRKITW